MAKNPNLPDYTWMKAAGIDPKTGLPTRLGNMGCVSKAEIKQQLRIMDEQDAINTFKWYGLPGLLPCELERFLYYKYDLVSFYMEEKDKFYHMPYALDGTLDFYGRYNTVHPIPMTEGQDDKQKKMMASIRALLSKLKLNIVKEPLWEMPDYDDFTKSGVILRDYTPQGNINKATPMADVIDSVLDMMADTILYMHTALKNATGIEGIRITNEDESSNVYAANLSLDNAALTGSKFVPISGKLEFQELVGGQVGKAEEFLMVLQSLDNYRLMLHGLNSGGLFQKKAHMLESENDMNAQAASNILQDRLTQRQNWCNIFNSIWGIGVWCDVAEPVLGMDKDGDGDVADDQVGTDAPEGGDNDV